MSNLLLTCTLCECVLLVLDKCLSGKSNYINVYEIFNMKYSRKMSQVMNLRSNQLDGRLAGRENVRIGTLAIRVLVEQRHHARAISQGEGGLAI